MIREKRVYATEWLLEANCRDKDPEIFFVTGAPHPRAVEACKACPVRQECRDRGDQQETSSNYLSGYLGGETPSERRYRRTHGVSKKTRELYFNGERLCPQGHLIAGDNVIQNVGRSPECRECRNANNRRYWKKYRSHCKKGHPYSEENTEFDVTNRRRCIQCRLDRENRPECPNGHKFVEGSFSIQKNNRKVCLICQRARAAKYKQKRRQK